MKPILWILLLFLLLTTLLASCSPAVEYLQPTLPPTLPIAVTPIARATATVVPPAATDLQVPGDDNAALERTDAQGSIEIAITPLNLTQASDTLDFDVRMDTHSIDLSMDLAVLSTLTTDTGMSVQALQWDAPMGGHHVAGTLIFPANLNGTSVLAGAKTLTMTLVNVDAPERNFTWPLNTP